MIDDEKGRYLYAVLEVNGVRWMAYKANIYGQYEGLPVDHAEVNWSRAVNTAIYDLKYEEENLKKEEQG